MSNILAIDQGTHASRAAILDEDGRVLAHHLVTVPLRRPTAERAEQDAQRIVDSVDTAIETVLHQLGPRARNAVRCCGLATQRSTVLAWRAGGAPLSAAVGWQDTRGAGQLARLRSRAAAVRKLSGLPLSPHYGATKLHWLQQRFGQRPDIRLGPLSSFLLDRLTREGAYAADHCTAQRTQLLDIGTLDWSAQLAAWFDVRIAGLPAPRPVCAAYGLLRRWDIPVSAVSGDQNAAWYAAGEPRPGAVVVNLGSGAFVLARQAGAAPPELLSSVVYSDAQRSDFMVEGTVNGAGSALRWLEERRGIAHLAARLPQWLEQVKDPPLFLNTVGGLGSPWWRQGVEPVFADESSDLDDARLAAGVAESILFLVEHNLERMAARATPTLRVSGGLARITPLCQKLANLSGCPVERPDDREATLRGIAWLAAGRPHDWQPDTGGTTLMPVPDPTLQARYERFTDRLRQHIENSMHD